MHPETMCCCLIANEHRSFISTRHRDVISVISFLFQLGWASTLFCGSDFLIYFEFQIRSYFIRLPVDVRGGFVQFACTRTYAQWFCGRFGLPAGKLVSSLRHTPHSMWQGDSIKDKDFNKSQQVNATDTKDQMDDNSIDSFLFCLPVICQQ